MLSLSSSESVYTSCRGLGATFGLVLRINFDAIIVPLDLDLWYEEAGPVMMVEGPVMMLDFGLIDVDSFVVPDVRFFGRRASEIFFTATFDRLRATGLGTSSICGFDFGFGVGFTLLPLAAGAVFEGFHSALSATYAVLDGLRIIGVMAFSVSNFASARVSICVGSAVEGSHSGFSTDTGAFLNGVIAGGLTNDDVDLRYILAANALFFRSRR